jgi:oligoendopeptidase F
MATTQSRTDDVRWNLSDLCTDAAEARAAWPALVERSAAFAERYRGKIASLDAAGMRAVLDEADELAQELSRLQVYTFLRQSMDATDVEANDLTTIGRDRAGDIENDLIFLGLEWIALDDDAAEALLGSHRTRTSCASSARRSRTSSAKRRSRRSTRAPPSCRRGSRCTTARCRRSRSRSTAAKASVRTL